MRIGLVCPYSLTIPGGVQAQVLGLARALRALGHPTRVLAPCDGPPPDAGVTPLGNSIPTAANGSVAPLAPDLPAQLRAIRAARDEDFDVLNLHEPLGPGACMTMLVVKPAPLVGTFHAAGVSGAYRSLRPLVRKLAGRLDVRAAVSDDAEALARSYLGGTYEKVFNGIEIPFFADAEPTPTDGTPTILFLGRHDERKGLQVLLDALLEQEAQALAAREVLARLEPQRPARRARVLVGRPSVEVGAGVLPHGLLHRHPRPRAAEMDDVALIGDVGRPEHAHGDVLEQVLDQVHDAAVVGERLIELDRRELGVVARVHALVAEDAADLVYALEPADDQPLQVKLRLDAQEHVDVERVVMRDERPGRRADLEGAEHRRVDLEEAVGIEVLADRLDDLRARDKGLAHVRVHDHVQIPLAIAQVGVLEAVELLRQRVQALREQRDLPGVHGHLAQARAEHRAADADHVSEVEVLEARVGVLADVVRPDVDLYLAVAVEEMREARLAHHAARHHAPGDGHFRPLERGEIFENLGRAVRLVEARQPVRAHAVLFERPELVQAYAVLFGHFLSEIFGHAGIPPMFDGSVSAS